MNAYPVLIRLLGSWRSVKISFLRLKYSRAVPRLNPIGKSHLFVTKVV